MTRAVELAQVASLGVSEAFKNRIINGAMVIDQRNAGASFTQTTAAYCVDRWNVNGSASSKFTVQQNAGAVTPPLGFTNYLGITSLSSYSVAAGDYFYLMQGIEGFNVADLGWGTANAKTVTVSFWVRSSLTGTFGGVLRNLISGATRSYPFTYSINAANTWELKSITVAGDITGTWATGNGNSLTVCYGLGTGSTFSGTAGAWVSSNLISATGAVSVVGTNGATFYITGVQLEVGTQATSFEYRQYGQELVLCQRYFEGGVARWRGYDTSATVVWTNFFKVTKRATPTMTGTSTPTALDTSAFTMQASGAGTVDTGNVTWTASIEL
jgi:hypothetical protein